MRKNGNVWKVKVHQNRKNGLVYFRDRHFVLNIWQKKSEKKCCVMQKIGTFNFPIVNGKWPTMEFGAHVNTAKLHYTAWLHCTDEFGHLHRSLLPTFHHICDVVLWQLRLMLNASWPPLLLSVVVDINVAAIKMFWSYQLRTSSSQRRTVEMLLHCSCTYVHLVILTYFDSISCLNRSVVKRSAREWICLVLDKPHGVCRIMVSNDIYFSLCEMTVTKSCCFSWTA